MKKFWKVLGITALAAGLIPYKVEKNEETGENSYQALLWRITSAPGETADKKEISINFKKGALTSKLAGGSDESHLFSDELCVEYAGGEIGEAAATTNEAESAEPAAPQESEEPKEEEAGQEAEAPQEPETPEETETNGEA